MEAARFRRNVRITAAIGIAIMVIGALATFLWSHYAGLAIIIIGLFVTMLSLCVTRFFNMYDLKHIADRENRER